MSKPFTTASSKQFLTELYETVTKHATKQDESTDSTGVHLERWLYGEGDYIVIRTDEMIHTIYNQVLNNMYTAN
jgi:hypothetical protein